MLFYFFVLIVLLASFMFNCSHQTWVLVSFQSVLCFPEYGTKSSYFSPMCVTRCPHSLSPGTHTLHSHTCLFIVNIASCARPVKWQLGGGVENEEKQLWDANPLSITQRLLWIREIQLQNPSLTKLFLVRIQTFQLKIIIPYFPLHAWYRHSTILLTILCLSVSYVKPNTFLCLSCTYDAVSDSRALH